MLIDTHCHIDNPLFDSDRAAVLKHCQELGIHKIVVPAVMAKDWDSLISLCSKHENLVPALGLHPMFIDQHNARDLDKLREYLSNNQVCAVGEIGLDFYDKKADKNLQLYYFENQLMIANEFNLPVILHVRKAHDHVISLLKKHQIKAGIAHAFNGSMDQARQYLDLGFKLGFGGTLTYDNARKIHKLAAELPIEALVMETDAPDMVVSQHKGERNSPEYLTECVAALANIRKSSLDHIMQETTRNACEVLNLSLQ